MRKLRKSNKDIQKDFEKIIKESNSINNSIKDVIKYIGKTIKTKPLNVTTYRIFSTFLSALILAVFNVKRDWFKNKKIYDNFMNAIHYEFTSTSYMDSNSLLETSSIIHSMFSPEALASDVCYLIILNSNIQYNVDEIPQDVLKREPNLKKLYSFLLENIDVSLLIKDTIYKYNENTIFEWISSKKIPLKTIKYFINYSMDIKENTEYLYKKLNNKKLTRTSIQNIIIKNYRKL